MKKVGIAMAVHNVEMFIIPTLSAIQKQTYKDFVCYIVDDWSTDNTVQIIYNMFCKQDDRFKLYVNCTDKNNPYIDAHNLSYQVCDSEYIIRLDGDDIPDITLIEKYVEFMDSHYEYDACCSTVVPYWSNTITGQLEKPEDSDQVWPDLKRRWFDVFPRDEDTDRFNNDPALDHVFNPLSWCNQCSCIRREFMLKHKLKFKHHSYGDFMFWTEFFACGGNAYKLKDKLLIYRINQNSISHKGDWLNTNDYFELDLAKAKVKLLKMRNNPDDIGRIRVFENTVKYFENIINKGNNNKNT